MNDTHFDAFAGHMQAALNALEVPTHLAAMVMAIVFGSRGRDHGPRRGGLQPDQRGRRQIAEEAVVEAAVETLVEAEAEPAPAKAAKPAAKAEKAEGGETKDSAVASQTIRVTVEVLEDLMTLVSELVLTRNQLLQLACASRSDSAFAVPLQRLSHITSELQEGVMKTRMQPIGNAWAKLPRLVRDLARRTRQEDRARACAAPRPSSTARCWS